MKQKWLFGAFQAVLINKASPGYDSSDHLAAISRITTSNIQNILSEYTLIIYQERVFNPGTLKKVAPPISVTVMMFPAVLCARWAHGGCCINTNFSRLWQKPEGGLLTAETHRQHKAVCKVIEAPVYTPFPWSVPLIEKKHSIGPVSRLQHMMMVDLLCALL